MSGTVRWLAVAVVVMVAGDGVSAQGAQAFLRHVTAADVTGTGTRRICFSGREINLYVLVTEAIDREQAAAGQILDADSLAARGRSLFAEPRCSGNLAMSD